MMAGEMDAAGEFWLPSDFLSDDFFLDGNKSPETETESENEDYMAGLTKKMATSFLHHHHQDDDSSNNNKPFSSSLNPSVLGTSPQSTLCGIGSWSFSSNGSPDGPSQVSSPPSTPFPQPRDDALELLYAAAGQVVRLGLHDANYHPQSQAHHHHQVQAQAQAQAQARGLYSHPHQNPNPHPQIRPRTKTHSQMGCAGGLISSQDLIQQQLQAARFYQLKRQQLLKQQYVAAAAALGRPQSREKSLRPLGLSTSAWPPLQKQHQSPSPPPPPQQPTSGSGMTAVFLNGGARRQSTGTGVFLPRRVGTPNEPRKKQACSTVLLPARVVQALNLNLDDMGVHARVSGSYMVENDGLMGRSVGGMNNNYPKRSPAAPASNQCHHEVRLPQEWTY